ncbi:nucleotide sugar dehydrogenase [Radicibacter daui]|uniref:nucleotide sugar dehydrogenase n=1 Tax=Radicibacter daui TaxID=3064829 RepID=UPI004046D07A
MVLNSIKPSIAVVGLGYVGLPLAIALARHFPVTGFDISPSRLAELRQGKDRTREVDAQTLKGSALSYTDDLQQLKGRDVYIVTVPTPVDGENKPDLVPLLKACASVGSVLAKGAVVVFESTVYPGVSEDICGPALEQASGLVCGTDFFLGYSPERINPGDKIHTVDKITKVVAGQTPEVTALLAEIYGQVTSGGIFQAASIKTAEAAKVIENAQRDINIAFINEVAQIFSRLGLSVHDVLEASRTKWNFLPFTPGLVGGHCIGVDPYYLADCARQLGHNPDVILAGRRMNDGMGGFIAEQIADRLGKPGEVLVLGLTFKEDVPDLRNSRVVDIIHRLQELGHIVTVHDPMADPSEAKDHYDIDLVSDLKDLTHFDCVLGAVSHAPYKQLSADDFSRLCRPGGLVADIKAIWRNVTLPKTVSHWIL